VAAALVAPAVVASAPADSAAAPPSFPATPAALLAAIGSAMVLALFTYDGYADAVYLAGETRDPGRALPRALFTALLTITGLYLLANATFLHVLGVERLSRSKFAALDVANAAFGPSGGAVLTAIALIVLLGAVNAYFLSGPRIARVLAEEGLALPALGRVRPSGVPAAATLWIVAVAIAFALTNTFGQLLQITIPIISATTACVAVGLLVQRRRAPDRPRPFRLRGAALVVGLQVAISTGLLVSYVAANPTALLIDALAVLIGLAVYGGMRRWWRQPGGCAGGDG
jgi:APA family basic amino acid/polyamine antiporter